MKKRKKKKTSRLKDDGPPKDIQKGTWIGDPDEVDDGKKGS
jgi:hypothetical protein